MDKAELKKKFSLLIVSRTYSALKDKMEINTHYCLRLVGCEMDFFITHLANQFKEGMRWDNHGVHGWHIDHIRPIASFDLSDIEQVKKCFHYRNMQPLWSEDNLFKKAKYDLDGCSPQKQRQERVLKSIVPKPVSRTDYKYPFHRLKIGENFLVKYNGVMTSTVRGRLSTELQKFKKDNPGYYFSIRAVEGGAKCYRVESKYQKVKIERPRK